MYSLKYRNICLLFMFALIRFQGYTAIPSDNILAGEYILEVSSEAAILEFFNKTASYPEFSDLTIEKLTDVPFRLWLLKTNPYNEHLQRLEKILRSAPAVKRFFKNKILNVRKSPDDPLLSSQWQYENTGQSGGLAGADMEMFKAWDISTGGVTYSGDTIVVAVLDDGVNGRHPDMADNMWIHHNEIPGNGIDDDMNGYIDDYFGWNVTLNNDDVYSGGGHGTPVAGIIGAKGNNALGVSGVNWHVRIMIVNYGEATEARALASYGYVYKMRQLYNESNGEKGAFIAVTNASWGIDGIFADEAALWCELYDALGEQGIVNVAATSNSNVDVDEVGDMPSTCESEFLIVVTNVNRQDIRHTGGSAYGRKSVDIGAFGHQVYTVSRNSYGIFGGTSGAAPHVSGLAGLMFSAPCALLDSLIHTQPALSALVIKDMLLLGAEPNPSLENLTSSGGRVNAYRAMSNLMDLCGSCSVPAGVTLFPTDTSVVIQWPFNQGFSVSVRYKKAGELSWTVVDNVTSGFELSRLDFCTEYEIQWSSPCGFLPGVFGYSKFFRTEGCCQLPDEIQADIAPGSVTITLNHSDNAWYRWSYSVNDGEVRDTVTQEKGMMWSGLEECQTITFTLQSQCLKYNNVSEISTRYIYSTPCGLCTENSYCQFGRKTNSQEWIRKFHLHHFINESAQEPEGYTHFLGLHQIRLKPGYSYPYELEVGYLNDAYSEYLKIYIDFNQNGVFEEEEEVSAAGPQAERFLGSVYIPEDAREGYTLMRVILTYDDFEGACDSPDFEFGEIEDYCVLIEKECPVVTHWVITDTTTSGLKFQVEKMSEDTDSLRLDIRATGTASWDSFVWKDSVWIHNLIPCQEYEYSLFSLCGTEISKGTDLDTVKTLCFNNTEEVFSGVKVFPNPAQNSLFVVSNDPVSPAYRLEIVSMEGKIHMTEESILENKNSWEIDITSLPSGMYMLVWYRLDGQVTPVRFIVMKD